MKKEHVIDRMGGTGEVARLCDVTTGAVSQWRHTGIPKARLMFLRLAKPEAFELPAASESLQPHAQPPHVEHSTPTD